MNSNTQVRIGQTEAKPATRHMARKGRRTAAAMAAFLAFAPLVATGCMTLEPVRARIELACDGKNLESKNEIKFPGGGCIFICEDPSATVVSRCGKDGVEKVTVEERGVYRMEITLPGSLSTNGYPISIKADAYKKTSGRAVVDIQRTNEQNPLHVPLMVAIITLGLATRRIYADLMREVKTLDSELKTKK